MNEEIINSIIQWKIIGSSHPNNMHIEASHIVLARLIYYNYSNEAIGGD
jgi:hypothetical protein